MGRVNHILLPLVADIELILLLCACVCVCTPFLQAGVRDRSPGERRVTDIGQGAGAEGAAEGDGALY